MNKFVTLTVALLASQVLAADVSVGTSFAVQGTVKKEDSALLGLNLNADYQDDISDKAGYFASASVFVPAVAMKDGGPKHAMLAAGGVFSNPDVPNTSVQLGVVADITSPSEEGSSTYVAPGLMSAVKLGLSDDWSMRVSNVVTMPSTKYGQVDNETVVLRTSLGLVRDIAIDA